MTAYLAHQGSIALPLLSSVRVDGAALAWTVPIAVRRAAVRSGSGTEDVARRICRRR